MRRESIISPSAETLAFGRPAHVQQQQQQQLESRPKFGAWRHAGACLAFVGVIVLVTSSPRDDRASARPAMASARMDAMLADAEAKVAVAKAAELKAQAELARIRALRKTEALPPSTQQATTMPTATVTGASAQQLQGEFAVAHHRLVASIEPPRLLSRFAALCAGLALRLQSGRRQRAPSPHDSRRSSRRGSGLIRPLGSASAQTASTACSPLHGPMGGGAPCPATRACCGPALRRVITSCGCVGTILSPTGAATMRRFW